VRRGREPLRDMRIRSRPWRRRANDGHDVPALLRGLESMGRRGVAAYGLTPSDFSTRRCAAVGRRGEISSRARSTGTAGHRAREFGETLASPDTTASASHFGLRWRAG